MGRVGTYAMGLLTVSLGAWVRSGLAGTAEMNRFNLAMQSISREIAGVFQPWIIRIVEGVTQLAAKFRTLTGAQQEQIRQWVALAAAISGSMILLPRFVGMLATVASGFKAVGLARVAALAGPLGLAVGAGIGALAATDSGREALGRLLKSAQPLFEALGDLTVQIVDILSPVLIKLAEWLAVAVTGMARFVEAIGQAINWITEKLGRTTATREELQAELGGVERAKKEDPRLYQEIGQRQQMTGEAWEAHLRRRLAEFEQKAAPQKTSVTVAPSGFEGAEALFRRIAGTVAKTDTARAADATEQSLAELQKIAAEIARLRGWSLDQALDRVRSLPSVGAP